MSNYSQVTAFGPKDALTTGDPNKKILGSNLDTEFGAIATAIASKLDASGNIPESQITDGAILARLAANETVSGNWTFSYGAVTINIATSNTGANLYIQGQGTGTNRVRYSSGGAASSSFALRDETASSDRLYIGLDGNVTIYNSLVVSGTISGNLNATYINAGTLNDARLSSNIPRYNDANPTFSGTGTLSFGGAISANNAASTIGGILIGYRNIPRVATTGTTCATSEVGKCYSATGNMTVPSGTFAAGDSFCIFNGSVGNITITQGSGLTMYWASTGGSGTRTLAAKGMCTVWFESASVCVINGGGLS